MTVGEIVLKVEVENEKTENEFKKEIMLQHNLAQLISSAVVLKLSGKTFPSLKETYPALFSDTEQSIEDNSWMIYKERFLDFANEHNKKWGEKNK